jgi:hypothetical protein
LTRECRACHSQCRSSCTRPDDPTACSGSRSCVGYRNLQACVSTCPSTRPYFVDCTVSDNTALNACVGGADLTCVGTCPNELPYFNDTSVSVADDAHLLTGSSGSALTILSGPQICVATCAEIGRVTVDGGGGTASSSVTTTAAVVAQRCVTEQQASALRSGDSSNDDRVAMYIVICAAVGVALVATVVYIVCTRSRRKEAVLNDVSSGPSGSSTNNNNNGVYRDHLGFALPPPGAVSPAHRRPQAAPVYNNPVYQPVTPRGYPMNDSAMFATPQRAVSSTPM